MADGAQCKSPLMLLLINSTVQHGCWFCTNLKQNETQGARSAAESTHKGVNQRSKYVTQAQQQRPESPTVTLTWNACKYKVPHKLHGRRLRSLLKLPALVYDILPSTTAIFSYVIGSRKLSANEQFFVGAQTVVSLLQTIQIKQCVSFIAANKVYTSTNKTTIVWIETELFFSTRGGCVSCLRACLGARLLLQSYQ